MSLNFISLSNVLCFNFHSYVVLENVDKAQTKIRLRKDNVAG